MDSEEIDKLKEREKFLQEIKELFEDVSGTAIGSLADADRAVNNIIAERTVRIHQEQRIHTLEKVIVDQAVEIRSLRNVANR